MNDCPCGSGKPMEACCLPYLQGMKKPETASLLMCSRYTAYTLHDEAYLLKTWHANTRPVILNLADDPSVWQSLKILSCEGGLENDREGKVEFIARYRLNDKLGALHETSRFIREEGAWFYLDGDIKPEAKPGRNDPCFCGSQKKFKKCCGRD